MKWSLIWGTLQSLNVLLLFFVDNSGNNSANMYQFVGKVIKNILSTKEIINCVTFEIRKGIKKMQLLLSLALKF